MTPPAWLIRREPPVPESFYRWLQVPGGPEEGDGGLPDPTCLREAALAALARALSPAGRERGGAFDLLAADALVTWAAEAALDRDDPEALLRSLVRDIARAPDR